MGQYDQSSIRRWSLIVVATEQRQEHPEDHHDVHEDLDGCENVILWTDLVLATAHDHLNVNGQIDHEEQSSQTGIDRVQEANMEHSSPDDRHQPEQHQNHRSDEHESHHTGQVMTCLH